jgi:type II secretory pathway component GspD/PulD (secretin)
VKTAKAKKATAAQVYVSAKLAASVANPVITGSPTKNSHLTAFELRYTKASKAASVLKQLLKAGDVSLVAVEDTNSLLVQASQANTDQVRALLANLDVPSQNSPASKPPKVIRILPLKYARANDTAQEINVLMDDAKECKLSVDQRTNSLLVSGTDDTINEIQALVNHLDRPTDGDSAPVENVTTHVIHLTWAKTDEMMRVLSSFEHSKGVLSMVSDPRTNSVIIRSTGGVFNEMMDVIKRLDISEGK